MIFRFFRIFDPFRRKLKEKRYWDLKKLAEKQGLISTDELPDETTDDDRKKSSGDSDRNERSQ